MRVRRLPLYRALDLAVATRGSRAKQERALRTMAHNREFEVRELSRPLSSFVTRDANGHVVDDTDLHMIRFVRMTGNTVSVRDPELRERCRVFGLDGSPDTWSTLPREVRRRALHYRREALELARRDAFALPEEEIKPATWRSWIHRAGGYGATFIPLEVSGELHPEPYTGARWR
jgi:hypothetical protein